MIKKNKQTIEITNSIKIVDDIKNWYHNRLKECTSKEEKEFYNNGILLCVRQRNQLMKRLNKHDRGYGFIY